MMTYLIQCYRLTHTHRLTYLHTDLAVELTPPPFRGSTENFELFMSVPSAANVPSTIIL